MVLTGRVMQADEALAHGVVSRVVPLDELDATAREMAEKIAAAPRGHGEDGPARHPPPGRARDPRSMADELIYQTFIRQVRRLWPRCAPPAPRAATPNYTGS